MQQKGHNKALLYEFRLVLNLILTKRAVYGTMKYINLTPVCLKIKSLLKKFGPSSTRTPFSHPKKNPRNACFPGTFNASERSKIGAVNGDRTHDPQLGKLMLYHLSYYREAGVRVGLSVGMKGQK